MVKNVLFSAEKDHEVIKKVIGHLKLEDQYNFTFHDPTSDFLDLSLLSKTYKDIDYMIVKVRNECSIDLLHFAKINGIPVFQDIDSVLMCKNKIAIDLMFRNLTDNFPDVFQQFHLPKSWTQTILPLDRFKKWANAKLPLVLKSHYQNDKHIRFNFLARTLEELDYFAERYEHALSYNVYIQEFIKCDGIDRKIYVIGDEVFGIERENPIYIFLRDKPDSIDCDEINRRALEITDDVRNLAKLISKELGLKIFGFDLVKPIDQEGYYILDLNYFPGLKGIPDIEKILANYIINDIKSI